MSYILDAIQKLEQKRQQEVVPNIFTLRDGPSEQRIKHARWPYAIAGIILLNGLAIVSFFWINPWRSAEHYPKTQPASLPAEKKQADPVAAHIDDPSRLPAHHITGQPAIPPPENIIHPKQTQPVQQINPVQPVPGKKKPDWPKNKLVAMQNLPETFRAALPDLKMTVHSYDVHSPLRFVIINDRNVKEGEFLNPDLKLVEIVPAGAILDYQGFKFILGIN